jgi:hypothetical protein
MQTTLSFLVSSAPPPSWFPIWMSRGACFGCFGTILAHLSAVSTGPQPFCVIDLVARVAR